MHIIPAIDLRGGRCVRLLRGRFDQETVFSDDPVGVARRWAAAGPAWIHVVDLDGAREGEPRHLELMRAIAAAVPVPVQVGGGIRQAPTCARLLAAGAARVVVGTAALDPRAVEDIMGHFGDKIVLALDAERTLVRTHGWRKSTQISAFVLARQLAALGARRFLFTDIARDGALTGPDLASIGQLVECVAPLPVIASGGICSLPDVRQLKETGCEAAIIGRALYTGALDLAQAIAEAA